MSRVARFEPCMQPCGAGPRGVTVLSFGNVTLGWLLIQAVPERGARTPARLKELSQKLLALP